MFGNVIDNSILYWNDKAKETEARECDCSLVYLSMQLK